MISMRRILSMIWFNISRTLKSPGDFALVLLLPIAVSLGISTMFRGQGVFTPAHVAIVNEDGGQLAGVLIDALEGTPFRVHVVTRQEAEEAITHGKWSAGLVIPAGFSAAVGNSLPELEVLHGDRSDGSQVAARAKLVVQALAHDAPLPAPAIIAKSPRQGIDYSGFSETRGAFGIYLMFAFMTLLGRAGTLHIERKEGRLQRTLANGVPYREIVSAHVCSIILIGILQASLVVAITSFLGIEWFAAGLLAILLPLLAALFAGAGVAVAVSGLTRTATQTQVISGGLPSLMAMLGGAFFPLEVAPANVQQLAVLNPIYWSLEALTDTFVYEGTTLMIPLVALLVIGSLGMMLGIQGLRRMAL